jgi:hypothetical protein
MGLLVGPETLNATTQVALGLLVATFLSMALALVVWKCIGLVGFAASVPDDNENDQVGTAVMSALPWYAVWLATYLNGIRRFANTAINNIATFWQWYLLLLLFLSPIMAWSAYNIAIDQAISIVWTGTLTPWYRGVFLWLVTLLRALFTALLPITNFFVVQLPSQAVTTRGLRQRLHGRRALHPAL